jgi:hypothetical protein
MGNKVSVCCGMQWICERAGVGLHPVIEVYILRGAFQISTKFHFQISLFIPVGYLSTCTAVPYKTSMN